MNLPNLITCFRIIASFVFVFFGAQKRWEVALPIFCVAAFSDLVDGSIARLFHQRTQLGAFLDPVADKLLMLFGFVTLTLWGPLPVVLTFLVIFRDVMISAGVIYLRAKKISFISRPTYPSKITTLFQMLTVFLALFGIARRPLLSHDTQSIIWTVTGLLTTVTTVQYLRIGLRIKNAKT